MTNPNTKDPFTYQRPTEQGVQRIEKVRDGCRELLDILKANVPASRELSLAITNLEQVSMWANKGIAFNGDME